MSSSLRFEKEGVRLDWLRKTFVTARRRLQNESAPGRRRSSWNSPKKTKALDPSYANLIGKKRKCKRYSSRGQVNDYPAAFLPGCLFAGVLGGQKGQKIGSFSGAEVQTERKRWKVLKMKKGCGKKKHFESSENCWHSILSGFFFSRQCLSHLLRLLSSIPFLFVPKAAEPVWMISCSCVLFVSEKSAVDTSVQHASTEKLDGLVQTCALYFVDLVLKAVVVFPPSPFPWHGAFALLLLTVLSVFRDDGRDKLTFPPWNSRVVN